MASFSLSAAVPTVHGILVFLAGEKNGPWKGPKGTVDSECGRSDGWREGNRKCSSFRVPEGSSQTRARGAAAITRDAVCNVPEETVKVERDPVVKERE